MTTETSYARAADGTHIAYQVTGAGPIDIVLLRAWYSSVEHEWQEPVLARMYRRLGTVGRLIRLDRRGSGLSDRPITASLPPIEDRLDDIRAVLDAVGSRRAVLVGLAAGVQLCAVFAATYPHRTAGLVLYEPSARGSRAPDYPWAPTTEQLEHDLAVAHAMWGTRELAARIARGAAPSRANDERFVQWLADDQRIAATPSEAVALLRILFETDVRQALAAVHARTLVLARASGAEEARYVAGLIPDATFMELAGEDHMSISGDTDAVIRAIVSFIEGLRKEDGEFDRVLATVLLTDLVGSTRLAVELGDRRWAELLERHHGAVRALLARHRGREIDTAGDGFFAAFDGPGRAIRCACAIVETVRELGLEVRAGLHTGECEQVDDRLRGVAIHIGARVAALAGPSEVLVSQTVRDLVAGSGFRFADRGARKLPGVPGEWRIYSVSK